jgi:hypothetical protein
LIHKPDEDYSSYDLIEAEQPFKYEDNETQPDQPNAADSAYSKTERAAYLKLGEEYACHWNQYLNAYTEAFSRCFDCVAAGHVKCSVCGYVDDTQTPPTAAFHHAENDFAKYLLGDYGELAKWQFRVAWDSARRLGMRFNPEEAAELEVAVTVSRILTKLKRGDFASWQKMLSYRKTKKSLFAKEALRQISASIEADAELDPMVGRVEDPGPSPTEFEKAMNRYAEHHMPLANTSDNTFVNQMVSDVIFARTLYGVENPDRDWLAQKQGISRAALDKKIARLASRVPEGRLRAILRDQHQIAVRELDIVVDALLPYVDRVERSAAKLVHWDDVLRLPVDSTNSKARRYDAAIRLLLDLWRKRVEAIAAPLQKETMVRTESKLPSYLRCDRCNATIKHDPYLVGTQAFCNKSCSPYNHCRGCDGVIVGKPFFAGHDIYCHKRDCHPK